MVPHLLKRSSNVLGLHDTKLVKIESIQNKLTRKNINEKQLRKIKEKISCTMSQEQFDEKYKNMPLRPDVYFYRCFVDLLLPKFDGKREALLDGLLKNHILIPDTLMQYHDIKGSTRIKFDRSLSKYVISQGEHLRSIFYNQRR